MQFPQPSQSNSRSSSRRFYRSLLPLLKKGGFALLVCGTFLLTIVLVGGRSLQTTAHPLPTITAAAEIAPFQVPPLPYAYDALAPYIDARTMHLHHDKHHQTYVEKLNAAIAKYPELSNKNAAELIQKLDRVPEEIRTVVRNNAGGHLNHSLFWESMAPNQAGVPTGTIATAINQSFGSFDNFKQQFNQTGAKLFGSGWVWLVLAKDGNLKIVTSPNQDNPVMEGNYPLLGNDLWEHAYYLTYQNKRAEYLNAWWSVVNWDVVGQRLAQAQQRK